MECELIAEFKTRATSGFDINFRELLSRAFAVHAWGERWSTISPICGRPRHVHFRIDNSSAIAWQNKMASHNPRAQVVILLLGWWETSYRLCFSASHITGGHIVSPVVDVEGLTDIWHRIFARTPLPTPRLTSTSGP
ncbi:hypothetical protein PPTG_17300 [Phytophthora nicotianae INRA-310]|uniref:Uncharacterized protein n=1 Tax=Phytophthora nicotianae (strain INRA-310) TaxID=761204 RepID=W2PL58_PHYN3|nr:hypothetical protein PPTG_17300 [Phytophthora nicotianae INRA-310]ETN00984.1 hypothetical protein PPTG_17300 [Phytophthora nicotianae INRA-310]